MSLPAAALAPGSLLGSYQIIALRGAGAMGGVYEARHTLLHKRVAIKLMHPDMAADAGLVERFLREGRAASAIRHPHVVQVHDVGFHNSLPYLVMEFLEGADLRATLRQRSRLPAQEACDLLLPVIAAVAAAHESGVVHRDLKPDNVFLDRGSDGSPLPKVVDFGISKLADGGAKTATQVIMGSPSYMSPEQCEGRPGPPSDQWALGVMLYELCTGQLPFAADTQMALMFHICHRDPIPLRAHGVTLPPALEAAILRTLSKDPAQRFPSVRALGAALLPLASAKVRDRHAHELAAPPAVSQTPPAPVSAHQPVAPTIVAPLPHAPRRPLALVGLGVAALAAVLVFALRRTPAPTAPPPVSKPPVVAPAPVVSPVIVAPAPAPLPVIPEDKPAVAAASKTKEAPVKKPAHSPKPTPKAPPPLAKPTPKTGALLPDSD